MKLIYKILSLVALIGSFSALLEARLVTTGAVAERAEDQPVILRSSAAGMTGTTTSSAAAEVAAGEEAPQEVVITQADVMRNLSIISVLLKKNPENRTAQEKLLAARAIEFLSRLVEDAVGEVVMAKTAFDTALRTMINGYWNTISDRPMNKSNVSHLVDASEKVITAGAMTLDDVKETILSSLISSEKMSSEDAAQEYADELTDKITNKVLAAEGQGETLSAQGKRAKIERLQSDIITLSRQVGDNWDTKTNRPSGSWRDRIIDLLTELQTYADANKFKSSMDFVQGALAQKGLEGAILTRYMNGIKAELTPQ